MCYTPASYATPEDLRKKAELFKSRIGTVSQIFFFFFKKKILGWLLTIFESQTHWPHANIFPNNSVQTRLGQPETYTRSQPMESPTESDKLLKLAGVMPY
jgi:hypothetical protein